MLKCILQALFFIGLFQAFKADIFSSYEQMAKLVETEVTVTNYLKSLFEYQTNKLEDAKK